MRLIQPIFCLGKYSRCRTQQPVFWLLSRDLCKGYSLPPLHSPHWLLICLWVHFGDVLLTPDAQLSERWPLPLLCFQGSGADSLSVIKHWAIREKPNLYWQHGWFGTAFPVPGLQSLHSVNVKNEFLVWAGEVMIWAMSLLMLTRGRV